jgi:ATP-dependent DNA helicase DinG
MSSPRALALPSLFEFFGRGGLLQKALPAFENRPSQLEMARAVEEALRDRRHLFVEAGTGTGKTLAYLIPALRSGRRVIVSTGTRNLQEQLVFKDIPLAERALDRRLNVVCMKGRSNYACRQKIADFERQPELLDEGGPDQLIAVREWVRTSIAGDRSELESLPEKSLLWERLNARRETCTGQKCPSFETCFLTEMHRRAMEAELVVVNHHLFFADLVLKKNDVPGVLPPYDAVIFDEAHEIEDIAGQYFGVSASTYQVEDLCRDADTTLKREQALTPQLGQLLLRLREWSNQFFNALGGGEGDGRKPFGNRAEFVENNGKLWSRLSRGLQSLKGNLEGVRGAPEELHLLGRRTGELHRTLDYLLTADDPGAVFWYERRGRGVFLQATPIQISELLRNVLFTAVDTVVLASATLAVNHSFDYIRDRLGAEHARETIVASPFDFSRQSLLYIPAELPDPRALDFQAEAAIEIERVLIASRGRAFVLCTSYDQMNALHALLEPRLPFPILLQGTAPRYLLLERFRTTANAVLFATSSFWQGVDVQGEQLSCVIVDRLPFAPPGDPVTAARIRDLNQQGRNAFMEYQVPQAVLALKQGFGRLIRSACDRGVLVLLDPRILRQRYGTVFFESLPSYALTSDFGEVKAFFS